jgi:hypothetical protein
MRAAAEEAKFSISVDVVTLLATVRNRDGGIVNNLNKDDFVLEEDGRRQTIRYFSRESNLPLALGLVDTSSSQRGALKLDPSRASTSKAKRNYAVNTVSDTRPITEATIRLPQNKAHRKPARVNCADPDAPLSALIGSLSDGWRARLAPHR